MPKPAAAETLRPRRKTPEISFEWEFTFNPVFSHLVPALLALLAAGACVLYIVPMPSTIGGYSFPFDDAWIHLGFARTLAEHARYAYVNETVATSGSTSPLYVALLAVLRFITTNEFAASFIIGGASFAALIFFMYKIGVTLFPREQWIAPALALLVLLFPRLHSAAVSGMGTMLFTALIAASMYFYYARKSVLFFLFAGLSVFARPDGLIFLIAAVLHLVFNHAVARKEEPAPGQQQPRVDPRKARLGVIAAAALIVVYFLFNWALSGSLFPNTVAAKIAYYSGNQAVPFTSAMLSFYTDSLAAVFFVFVLIGLIIVIADLVARRRSPMYMPAAFLIGTILAYALFHPQLYEGARYLLPTFPMFALIAVWSIRRIGAMVFRTMQAKSVAVALNVVTVVVILIAAGVGIAGLKEMRTDHYIASRYTLDRHVAAGKWIKSNTPANAAVATHIPGAIGYYGERRVIDILGIVTPALLPSIGNLEDVNRVLRGMKATHIATLRERFEVVNMNSVFTTAPAPPEVLEIAPFNPQRTHIMAQPSSALNAQAVQLIRAGRFTDALRVLEQSRQIAPLSSRTFTLAGLSYVGMKDTNAAIPMLEQSIDLAPDYPPALAQLGDIYLNRERNKEGLSLLERAYAGDPQSQNIARSLEYARDKNYRDSLRAAGWGVKPARRR